MSADQTRFDMDRLDGRVAADPGAPEFPALAEALRRSGRPEQAREVALAGLESAPSRLAGRVALALAQMDLGAPELGRRELERVLDEMLEPYRLDAEPEAVLTPVDDDDPLVAFSRQAGSASAEESPSLEALGEHEIDAAFDEAESHAEEMVSPNTMAERVLDAEAPVEEGLAAASVHAPDAWDEASDDDAWDEPTESADDASEDDDFDFASSQTFHTRTMAGLLERQGDRNRAETIRESLERTGRRGAPAGPLPMDAASVAVDDDGAVEASARADATKSEAAHRARVVATLEQWLHNLGRGVA